MAKGPKDDRRTDEDVREVRGLGEGGTRGALYMCAIARLAQEQREWGEDTEN